MELQLNQILLTIQIYQLILGAILITSNIFVNQINENFLQNYLQNTNFASFSIILFFITSMIKYNTWIKMLFSAIFVITIIPNVMGLFDKKQTRLKIVKATIILLISLCVFLAVIFTPKYIISIDQMKIMMHKYSRKMLRTQYQNSSLFSKSLNRKIITEKCCGIISMSDMPKNTNILNICQSRSGCFLKLFQESDVDIKFKLLTYLIFVILTNILFSHLRMNRIESIIHRKISRFSAGDEIFRNLEDDIFLNRNTRRHV